MNPSREEVLRLMEATPDEADFYRMKLACSELVAMGASAVPGLIGALPDCPDRIGIGICRTLKAIGEPALEPLVAALSATTDLDRAAELAKAINYAASDVPAGTAAAHSAVAPLVALLRSPDPQPGKNWGPRSNPHESARAHAAWALRAIRDAAAVEALIEALDHHNYVCVGAARALGAIGDPAAITPLVALLQDNKKFWVPRGAAAVSLGDLGAAARSALPALREMLGHPATRETWHDRAREAVIDAIRRIEEPGSASSLNGVRYEMW